MISVIIAEDDPMVAQLNRRFLSSFSEIEVVNIFANGRKAFEYICTNHVDLVMVDITMPGMSGTELVRKAREFGISTDFIVVTAANDIQHIDEMLRHGIIDYLTKPFTMERLSVAVMRFLAKNKLFSDKRELNQGEIDSIVRLNTTDVSELPTGMQESTLSTLMTFITRSGRRLHTCESLSNDVSLSKVTVRRYLNHLVKNRRSLLRGGLRDRRQAIGGVLFASMNHRQQCQPAHEKTKCSRPI